MAEAVSLILLAAVAVALAVVHLVAGRLFLRPLPRSYWLSGAGGVSVAYVFVYVLPELGERQQAFDGGAIGFLEHHVYVLALAGFAFFYGLERLARQPRLPETDDGATETTMGIFWIHVCSFAAYNALIGYLLVHREEGGLTSLAFYAVAMGLHFVVNDHGPREHHHDVGRWLLASGVLAGFTLGVATTMTEQAVSTLFALLAGGVVLNVIKEELLEERRSNFWAFCGGAGAYAALLLFI